MGWIIGILVIILVFRWFCLGISYLVGLFLDVLDIIRFGILKR